MCDGGSRGAWGSGVQLRGSQHQYQGCLPVASKADSLSQGMSFMDTPVWPASLSVRPLSRALRTPRGTQLPHMLPISSCSGSNGQQFLLRINKPQLICSLWDTFSLTKTEGSIGQKLRPYQHRSPCCRLNPCTKPVQMFSL